MNVTALGEATEGLRRELRRVSERVADLARFLDMVQVQTERAMALSAAERDAPARMNRLEHVLDTGRTGAHVREAVRGAELVKTPVPHAIIADVLPADVYEAVVDALPPRIFFDGRRGPQELPVPPTLAPTHGIATWTFLAEMVEEMCVPALLERFEVQLGRRVSAQDSSTPGVRGVARRLSVSRGRIVRRQASDVEGSVASGDRDWLTVILYLARAQDGEDYGSRLGTSDVTRTVPFRANTALVLLHSIEGHTYVRIPDTAPAHVERYTCEFRLGPPQAGGC